MQFKLKKMKENEENVIFFTICFSFSTACYEKNQAHPTKIKFKTGKKYQNLNKNKVPPKKAQVQNKAKSFQLK